MIKDSSDMKMSCKQNSKVGQGKTRFIFSKKAGASEHICSVSKVVLYSTAICIKNLESCEMVQVLGMSLAYY